MKSHRRKTRLGFSLTELLVVIAIIVILAGIGVGSFAFVKERQDKEKARVQMALLSKAIEEYKMDMGEYPGTEENTAAPFDISDELYTALFYEGYDYDKQGKPTDWDKATKIYVPELDPTTSKQGWVEPSNVMPTVPLFIKDPWGANYRYRKGTTAENPDFDLWSSGKDGKSNTSNPAMSQEDNKDDLRNF